MAGPRTANGGLAFGARWAPDDAPDPKPPPDPTPTLDYVRRNIVARRR